MVLLDGKIKLIDAITPEGRFTCYDGTQVVGSGRTPNTGTNIEIHMRYQNTGDEADFQFQLQAYSDEPDHIGDVISTPWTHLQSGQESVHVHYLIFGLYGATLRCWLKARSPLGSIMTVDREIDIRIETFPAGGESTHILRLYYLTFPWFTTEAMRATLGAIEAVTNPLIQPLGFVWVHSEISEANKWIDVHYRKTGSPAFPLAAIITGLITLAIITVAGYFIWKIVEIVIQPFTINQQLAAKKTDFLTELLRLKAEGKITQAEYDQLLKEYEQITGGEINWTLLAAIGLAAIFLLSSGGKSTVRYVRTKAPRVYRRIRGK